ncbi:hypothetical protein GUITHDRAFT_132651 [Guillardia theta CCMP2712]|uniref:Uncharacterized protein n=1 Tax=Guillardia theta (strain CCMP2712) TaxID=905079 RepID=L1JZ98_GUITC|nr:hypothetical protein GUITHDRAFT_132651 [Guillardia theta CCMP2712]EKX53535.1 hypothetical protein GUITHDRAFT_132651 [Guillardia theta CCMP2712]|eukprot:XP_005840515.1 hypothetical protein GUITHDRAFT_132651 [Guillardia theta CCMP2712]
MLTWLEGHLRSSYPWKLARMRAEVKTSETSKITPVEYKDSWLDRKLQSYMEYRITRVLQNSADGDSSQTQELTLRLLRDSFPSWFPRAFGSFLRLFPLCCSSQDMIERRLIYVKVSTVFLTRWLVGESKVVDVDQDLLDPVQEVFHWPSLFLSLAFASRAKKSGETTLSAGFLDSWWEETGGRR